MHTPSGLQPSSQAYRTPRPTRPRLVRRALHGVLLLDKPLGWSSNDAMQRAKALLRADKAGHTGTLDPLATGLLPICFGAATKFSQANLDADKAYRATIRLGVTRVGGDGEGEVIETRPVDVDADRVAAACARFVGAIDQLPPMHSALKHEGKPLYRLARAGIEVERDTRPIHIHRLDIIQWQGDELVIDVDCSKGTYIRTLAEDIGEALGCGAHLAALRRTGSGALRADRAITLEALAALDEPAREALLLPCDTLIADWPMLQLDAPEAARFITGLRRRVEQPDAPAVRVFGPEPGALLGSAHITAGELIADRLLSPLEIQALIAAHSTITPTLTPLAAPRGGLSALRAAGRALP